MIMLDLEVQLEQARLRSWLQALEYRGKLLLPGEDAAIVNTATVDARQLA